MMDRFALPDPNDLLAPLHLRRDGADVARLDHERAGIRP
jgi:hypothetical protein